MITTIKEFNSARNDIRKQKEKVDFGYSFRSAKVFKFEDIEIDGSSVVINKSFVILQKHVTRLKKHFNIFDGNDLLFTMKSLDFRRVKIGELWLVWTVLDGIILAFIKTRYDVKTGSEMSPYSVDSVEFLTHLALNHLHAEATALAYVTSSFSVPEFSVLDKTYLCFKHIKSLVRFFLDSGDEYADFFYKDDISLTFNSKLLSRYNEPIVIKVELDKTGNITSFDLVDTYLEPLYLEFALDFYQIASSEAVVDKTAQYHLKRFKFREFVSSVNNDTIRLLEMSTKKSLSFSLYIRDLVVPVVYKGKASLAVKILHNDIKNCYAVGDYPTDSIFRIRTLMSPEIVKLNNMSVTQMYSAERIMYL